MDVAVVEVGDVVVHVLDRIVVLTVGVPVGDRSGVNVVVVLVRVQ